MLCLDCVGPLQTQLNAHANICALTIPRPLVLHSHIYTHIPYVIVAFLGVLSNAKVIC